MRKTVTPYTFPDTEVSLPAGTKVWIPNFAIQRDPKYFPDPDVFDPERFNEEAVNSRPAMTNLAFGDGPRNCIGNFCFFFFQLSILFIISFNKLNLQVNVSDECRLKLAL